MILALYSAAVSALFVLLAAAYPHAADMLVVAFFALLLVPSVVHLKGRR